ncbi:MAG: UDP-N-acetylmuramoyl-tripeptide--D-alanyl-D-alanine ligase [Candidatus Saccharibacteria bacterium]
MVIMTVRELAAVLRGRVLGQHGQSVIVSPGRITEPPSGQVFFLRRIRTTENNVLQNLLRGGISCVVASPALRISSDLWNHSGISIILVSNVRVAYMRFAQYNRSRFKIPFVQVIGSAGKTTTKEMIAAVARERFTALVSRENLNHPLEVAYRLTRLSNEHEVGIIEAGMNGPGTMRVSSRMIRPTIAVLTSIQRSHLPRLGSIDGIIRAKAEIMEFLAPNGTLIINGEDQNSSKFPIQNFRGKVLRHGFSSRFDLWATDIESRGFETRFNARGKGFNLICSINTFGSYNVGNALAAILVGRELGLTNSEITRGLAKYQPVEGRLTPHRARNRALIINDNFNANPDSTGLLMEELKSLARDKRVVLVLGDMEPPTDDIAEYAKRIHYEVGQKLADCRLSHVLVVGKWASEYRRGAVAAGFPKEKIEYFPTVAAAQNRFVQLAAPDTVVVLKSSHSVRLDRLMEAVM